MGTLAAVGMGTLEGWSGTLVAYDGYPSELGLKLLDLVRQHDGDLDRAWNFLASAPKGWRHAFTEPYEDDWEHYGFEQRTGPLLRHTDAYITGAYDDGALHLDGPEYWYLFDRGTRTLSVYAAPGRIEPSPPELLHTAAFDAAGRAEFDPPVDGDDVE